MQATSKEQDLIIEELGSKLKGKQKDWADSFLSNGDNGTQASRDAGYKGNDNTLCSTGKENLRKPHIKAYVDACKERDSKKLSITRESLLADIQYAKDKAKLSLDTDYPQYQHFLKASEMQAKMLGLNEPDKIDIQAELRVTCSRGAFAER
jgi:phage terminase small subunit